MTAAADRLRTLTVRDVMSPVVLSLSAKATLIEAASFFCRQGVTGAPIVDEQGRCVGLISMSDLGRQYTRFCPSTPEATVESLENVAQEGVTAHMTHGVHTVAASQLLTEAAEQMCNDHFHRLVVIDQEQRPIGVLTSLDIVASLVAACQEAN